MIHISKILTKIYNSWVTYLIICESHIQDTDFYLYLFINIWFAIRRLNKYILYAKGLSKGTQVTQGVKWNEMYKWKDYMKYPGYEHEQLGAQG